MSTDSLQRVLRNALIKAERAGRDIVRGPCGSIAACGVHWVDLTPVQWEGGAGLSGGRAVKLPASNTICLVCAYLKSKGRERVEDGHDVEDEMGAALGIDRETVLDLIAGFDGEPGSGGEAWRLGRKLGRAFTIDR